MPELVTFLIYTSTIMESKISIWKPLTSKFRHSYRQKNSDKLIVYEKAIQRRGFDTLIEWNELNDLHLCMIHKSIGNPDMIIFFIIVKMCKFFLVIYFIAADEFKGTKVLRLKNIFWSVYSAIFLCLIFWLIFVLVYTVYIYSKTKLQIIRLNKKVERPV